VLVELTYFFHRLCAKKLSQSVIVDMERIAPVFLYKLEKIFPSSFFNLMQHLILHLLYKARMGHAGPLMLFNREIYKGYSKEM
jgi:hypothetical protein